MLDSMTNDYFVFGGFMKSDLKKNNNGFVHWVKGVFYIFGGTAGVIVLFILLILLSLFFLTLFFGDGGLTLITPEYKSFS